MTRDELIEAMARAMLDRRGPNEREVEIMLSMFKRDANAALVTIEAQGMAIVPVEATDAMLMAGADTACYGDIAKAYDYMIEAGKL